jgi:hypothetical protein
METPGTTLARSLVHKVKQVRPAQQETLDQLVQQVHLAHLQLMTQRHLHLQKLVTLGLTQLMEKFMSTTIHIGLKLALRRSVQPDQQVQREKLLQLKVLQARLAQQDQQAHEDF